MPGEEQSVFENDVIVPQVKSWSQQKQEYFDELDASEENEDRNN